MTMADREHAYAQNAADSTERHGYAHTGLGLCADCVAENYRHDPNDPHIMHFGCDRVDNHMAIAVIDGRGVCADHLISRTLGEADR